MRRTAKKLPNSKVFAKKIYREAVNELLKNHVTSDEFFQEVADFVQDQTAFEDSEEYFEWQGLVAGYIIDMILGKVERS